MDRKVGGIRASAIISALVCVLMLGLPPFGLLGQQTGLSPVDEVAASAGSRVLTVGWPGFLSSLTTLNPLLAVTPSDMMAIWPCYSRLLTRDVNNQIVGDLASSFTVLPGGNILEFRLVTSARFYDRLDPSSVHPLTSADVIYTYWLVQNSSGNYLQSSFPVVNGAPIIQSMWNASGDPYHMYIQLSSTYAPFLSALSNIPILPRYLWSTQPWDWSNFRSGTPAIAPIIGSGPFYYLANAKPTVEVLELGRNPTWFAAEERGWQLHVNKLVIRSELNQMTNLADYLDGDVDIMMQVPPEQFKNASLPGNAYAVSQGFVYEYNLNQMTDDVRATLGNPYTGGSNNQLLLDPVVKSAIAMSVDKQAFVDQVLDGLGSTADSLVPDVSPWHYWYGLQPGEDPDRVGRAPVGEEPIQYNPTAARALLVANGWAYDSAGNPATPTTTPLCKAGGTSKLQFRYWTLNTAPEWNAGAQLLGDMAWAVGVDINTQYDPKTVSFMNGAWAAADYDMWLWDWMFSPTSDVSTDVMQVLTTEAIGSWSDVFWSNAEYDATYNESLLAVDPGARVVSTDRLQRMAYENMGCQLIAYRKDLYMASSLGPDHWQNYGNWEAKYSLVPDQFYPWLYMQIEPGDNLAPKITAFATDYLGDTDYDLFMTASAIDTQSLVYRWFFGDGSKTEWQTSPSVSHRYAQDGYYTAYLAVKENSGADAFVTWRQASVVIRGHNAAPYDVSINISPDDPDSGTKVHLNGSAKDDDAGDTLSYAWNFGDGTTTGGQNVTHQFMQGNQSYIITLSVDDGHVGYAPRPVVATRLLYVPANTAPTCQVPDVVSGIREDIPHNFTIWSTDPDTRDTHRYTFDWGDGSALSVSSVPAAVHTYLYGGVPTMTVWADDLTGLAGHNVSDTGYVVVHPNPPARNPVVVYLNASDLSPAKGDVVTFTGLATDPNGDPCIMTFDFGDGTTAEIAQPVANTTVIVTHAYPWDGLFAVFLTAFDGWFSDMSDEPLLIDVQPAFDLTLLPGWNFVSIPRIDFGYKASTLGLHTGDVVVGHDSVLSRYNRSYTVGVSPPFKDFWILPGEGYWVHCVVATTLHLQGIEPSGTQTRPANVSALGGWVLFGFVSFKTTYKASSIPSWYSGGSVSAVARYDPLTTSYQMWTIGSPAFKDFYLAPGQAYWVHVSASGTFTYLS